MFVFPTKKGDVISLGVFKLAYHLESGQRVSLVVLVLASIYRGLNSVLKYLWLDLVQACLLFQYVYDWLECYFNTNFQWQMG